MKKILTCKIFEGYINKKYKVKVEHRIFGRYEMKCVINGLIDDEERVGIVVHGKEIFCYKDDENFNYIEENNRIIMSDGLMEIVVENVQ